MKQWVVNYLETYATVENWISARSLFALESIHEFPSISIEFVFYFPKLDLDVDIFMELLLGNKNDVNRG